MFFFVKFVHVITAMVFFGLPFSFGRWFHSIALTKEREPGLDAIRRMRIFVRLHLNLCGAVLLATGLYLMPSERLLWVELSLGILVLALLNLNLHLGRVLNSYQKLLAAGGVSEEAMKKLRIHIAVFSAIHHTLVTAATAMMVFRRPI